MPELALNGKIIDCIKQEATEMVQGLLKEELVEVILYGSCARGDYSADSDVDIALIVRCGRVEAQKYNNALADIATELAMRHFAVVNFVCLPYDEFQEKKIWYAYFQSIATEGEVLYG